MPLRLFMQPVVKHAITFLLLAVLAYFTFFHQLGKLSLRYWDEASYALNAWEMLETGEYINLYQFGKSDFYNTKPPFAIWCMALSMKAGGINETAVRLPAAFFGFLSVCWLFVFCLLYLKNYWAGVWSAFILMTSKGFVAEHAARTGDTDAILAFFILFYLTIFYAFIIEQKARYIWLCAAGMVLACLTKGIAGLQGLPALFLLATVFKQWKVLGSTNHAFLSVLTFILIIGGYYVWRELKAPGFLSYVVKFEIGGRLHRQEYLNPEHRGFFYYIGAFYLQHKWLPWLWFTILCPVAYLFASKTESRKPFQYILLATTGLYAMAGISSTKNSWYDVPLYPLFSLCLGYSVALLMQSNWFIRYALMLLFASLFSYTFSQIVKQHIYREDDLLYRSFLNQVRETTTGPITIVNADFVFPINFYQKMDAYKGFTSCIKHPDDTFATGEKIIVFKEAREADMKRKYNLQLLQADEEAKLFQVLSLSPDTSVYHKNL